MRIIAEANSPVTTISTQVDNIHSQKEGFLFWPVHFIRCTSTLRRHRHVEPENWTTKPSVGWSVSEPGFGVTVVVPTHNGIDAAKIGGTPGASVEIARFRA